MNQRLVNIALLVRDYDEAIAWYTEKLGFQLLEDTFLSPVKRWVRIAPPGQREGCCLLLARAATPEQVARIGDQSGGRVFLFLFTDDFDRDYEHMAAQDISFIRPPEVQPHGKVAVFEDLYGNLWDFIEPYAEV